MSRCLICAELATGHGGDVGLAKDMIRAAADAGADYAKIQSYSLSSINPADPQAEWLRKAHLDEAAHEELLFRASERSVGFLSTPFDRTSLDMLRDLGLTTFKVASTESGNNWWQPESRERWIVSYPWGVYQPNDHRPAWYRLTAVPLYPTPEEAVYAVPLLDGWSDHCVGINAAMYQIARGAKFCEVHFTLPGKSREKPWDKTPEQIRQLRDWAETCATCSTGVSATFRNRWRR